MAYAEASDLTARYDERDVRQLSSDDDTPAGSADNAYVAAALDDASGEIDAALRVAGRYTTEQLEGLTGNSLALLKRMACEVAMTFLMERRPDLAGDRLERFEKIRERHLERLRKGLAIFDLTEAVEAGQPSAHGPSALQFEQLNLVRGRLDGKFYPRRRVANDL